MVGYYLSLAFRSLRRSAGLTALMALSIGIGVALAMSTWTLVHMMARDPIPKKSAVLYFPTVDSLGAAGNKKFNRSEPPDWLDYATATALLSDHRAKYQSAIYTIAPTIMPKQPDEFPFQVQGFAVTNEFFLMVDAPFLYGADWSGVDESKAAQVAVITTRLSIKLFGAGDSIGKTITVNGRGYRVVGVIDNWNPQPVFFDLDGTKGLNGFATHPTELYLPLSAAVLANMRPDAYSCIKKPAGTTFEAFRQSNCLWLSYMVQLDTLSAAAQYEDYLHGFAHQRFDWPANVRLRDLMASLNYHQVVPAGFKVLRLIGAGLLIVCLVDTVGLMLANFLSRSGEIGVRRALGAPRRAIYAQFVTQGAIIGVMGGVVGIVLTWLAMAWMRAHSPGQWEPMTQSSPSTLALTLVVAIVATLLVALYPAWRAAHVQPAIQIKTN